MKRASKKREAEAVGRSPAPDCWPLPKEWDRFIPPNAVEIGSFEGGSGYTITGPRWNKEWLRGLEAYVRSIVRDELSKANTALTLDVQSNKAGSEEAP